MVKWTKKQGGEKGEGPKLPELKWPGRAAQHEKIAGELARWLINQRKMAIGDTVWNGMSEAAQKRNINDAAMVASNVVTHVMDAFASSVFVGVKVDLESITIKDGAKLVLLMDKHDEKFNAVVKRVGGVAYLALSDQYQFGNAHAHGVKPEPQQKELPVHPDTPPQNDGNAETAGPEHTEVEPPRSEVEKQIEEGSESQPDTLPPERPPTEEYPPSAANNGTSAYVEGEL